MCVVGVAIVSWSIWNLPITFSCLHAYIYRGDHLFPPPHDRKGIYLKLYVSVGPEFEMLEVDHTPVWIFVRFYGS